MLHRSTLPRDEVLMAFVLACGCGEEEAELWRSARTRLAMGEPPPRPDAGPEPSTGADSPYLPPRKWTYWLSMLLGTALLLLLPTGGSVRLDLTRAQTPQPSLDQAGPDAPIAAGPYRIRIPGSDRCLSASKGRDGRIRQIPCADAFPKRFVQPLGDGRYRINTQHPELGLGCMGVRNGEIHDDYCGERSGNQIDRFRLERAGTGDADRRIRVADGDQCLAHSVPPHDMAPLWLRRCTPATAELVFTFEPDPGRS
ncbi:RICIN domain-containing protein [Spongiactinospora rosea]|uniref:RICIN domain-containing protein n=1 Tax=Spongiactinospora rosea TaxID=2248750 RepID=UPI0011C05924|nr:hypothetical protein [Spongiactinospora rosea]